MNSLSKKVGGFQLSRGCNNKKAILTIGSGGNKTPLTRCLVVDYHGPATLQLFAAIHGNGAFRRFTNFISENGLQEDLFVFQNNCNDEIATQWLDSEKIPWTRTKDLGPTSTRPVQSTQLRRLNMTHPS